MRETVPAQDSSIILPRHVGIIMDGNGRWAKSRGLPRIFGHRQGAKVFGEIARYCRDLAIPYLTVYAFSTENWKRPQEEVDSLMNLMRSYLKDVEQYQKENIRMVILGEVSSLDEDLQRLIARTVDGSKNNTGITVNIALNYGGRDEIVRACKRLARACVEEEISPEQINETLMEGCLYTAGQPPVDLIIRPSGEQRLSNFLLWQSAYAEYVFMDVLWPDFRPRDFDKALAEFSSRERRFGGSDG